MNYEWPQYELPVVGCVLRGRLRGGSTSGKGQSVQVGRAVQTVSLCVPCMNWKGSADCVFVCIMCELVGQCIPHLCVWL